MEIECSFSSPLFRYDPNNFIRHLDLKVVAYTQDDDRVVVGRIAADCLSVGQVMNNGESLYQVCDADSAGWEEAHTILFEKDSVYRPELGIESVAGNLIFVWKSLFHPILDPYKQGIVNTVSYLFGADTVFAAWNYALPLTDKELSELGFRRIAGSKLLYRDLAHVAEYESNHPNGTETDDGFFPTLDDAKWIEERWKDEDTNLVTPEFRETGPDQS